VGSKDGNKGKVFGRKRVRVGFEREENALYRLIGQNARLSPHRLF
jgi:hypothetical protein